MSVKYNHCHQPHLVYDDLDADFEVRLELQVRKWFDREILVKLEFLHCLVEDWLK